MTDAPDPFVCVACERQVDCRWWSARDRNRALPPICPACETWITRSIGEPKAGSFMDRRNARRIAALAESLRSAAGLKEWSEKHGPA